MTPRDSSTGRPRVAIIGGGFAGLAAAQQLGRAKADVTLIDKRNFHLFQPLLYQVATGELSPANIACPLRGVLRGKRNVRCLLGEVVDIDLGDQRVTLKDQSIAFDYLILAAGSTTHYFGNDHWKKYAPGLKTVEDATAIRKRILRAFELAEKTEDEGGRQAYMTFVIVGGGPTGCELAGALAEVAFKTMVGDFRSIDPKDCRIILVEPSEQPLQHYPAPLPRRSTEALQKLGVEVRTGYKVVDIDERGATVQSSGDNSSELIETRTVIWAAGVKATPLGSLLATKAGMESRKDGRVAIEQDCSVPGRRNIFVCGDLAFFMDDARGELPCLAPVASQMGRHAAKCIQADLKSRPRDQFKYFDKGSLAVIGRYHAVGTILNLKLHGIVAWAIWLFVHLLYVTKFRNRLLVMVQWGWSYFTHDRSSRLITGQDRPAATDPKT